ncbi:MAG: hypothetical protein VX911_06935 [Candidatus Latescibacterota bacterium]|nr:hypothetical protein [Candidatus Latescibacterota bacterium]
MNDPIADGVEADYRGALSGSVPEAMDDARFGAAMAAACLVFAIIRVHRFPKLDARGAGVPGRLQVMSTLEAAARAAAAHRSPPHLRGWVLEAAALRRAWPDADWIEAPTPHTRRAGRTSSCSLRQPTSPAASDSTMTGLP